MSSIIYSFVCCSLPNRIEKKKMEYKYYTDEFLDYLASDVEFDSDGFVIYFKGVQYW